MANLVERAAHVAEQLLAAALPRRWRHVKGVALKAEQVALVLDPSERDVVVAAAWLHDIGYAPGVQQTGFHSLDGARWLTQHDFPQRVAALVAHHSCASFEAAERGLAAELAAQFALEESPTADALWYADMTTGPDGQDLDVRDRLAEIRERYGPDHLVTRFWREAEPTLIEAVERTRNRMRTQPI